MRLLDHVRADATLSPCGTYRYALFRDWFPKREGAVLWIMLNPSTADATEDDPTIRRCQSFARLWSYDGIIVANLFAVRSTDPAMLRSYADPVGPANDNVLASLLAAPDVSLVMAAWGVHGTMRYRDAAVIALAARAGRSLHCLGTTRNGRPKHPLYVPGDTTPSIYREARPVESVSEREDVT